MWKDLAGHSIRSQVVDQILKDIHHVGWDIVERDGKVTAALWSLQ